MTNRLTTAIDPPPKNDATRSDDPTRQRAPPELIPEDQYRDRDQTRQRPAADDRGKQRAQPEFIPEDQYRNRDQTRQRPAADDRGKQRAPPELIPEDQYRERDQTRQRPAADDRGKQLAPPAESIAQDRERTRQRTPAPNDRGKQRAPPESLPEGRDRTNPRQQQPSSQEDRNKPRSPAEVLQSRQYQHTERSPLFTRPSSPHPAYAAAGPSSRGHDAQGYYQPSPTDSDDIVLTDNRTQPPPHQAKTGFWARITGAMRDRGDPHPEPEHTHVRGRLPPQPVLPNILLFGSHGAGKSSLINMLAGQEASRTSDQGYPVFGHRGYTIDVGGREVVVWDVVGLQLNKEHVDGEAISDDAARNLHHLVRSVHGGLNLLIHCINAKRPNEALDVDYEAFYRIIGGRKVPIVLIVTGLEDQDPMEGWWKLNEAEIKKRGMTFDGHACITAVRGKPLKNGPGYWHDEQYEQSKLAVRELIKAKLGAAVIIREEGKLAELRELLREYNLNAMAVSQNGDKGKNGGAGISGSSEVNGGHAGTQNEWDEDTADRVEREGRTATLALLGGLFAVFIVLQSGIMSCI